MKLTPVSGPRGNLPGHPSARTLMAWDRTALVFVAHGALLIARHPSEAGALRLGAAALSLLLALVTALLGRARAVQIADSDTSLRASVPTRALVVLASGVLALGVLDAVSIARHR